MAISKANRVSKERPCRHCGKPDWCLVFDELEVCARGMIAPGWEETGKATVDGHKYLRRKAEPKGKRPLRTFVHEYRTADGRVFQLKREYREEDGVVKKSVRWVHPLGEVSEQDLLPYAWERAKDCDLLFLVEGELCVDRAWEIGIPAISIRGKTLSAANVERLKGKTIVLCPDRDKAGVAFAQKLYQSLRDVCPLKLALLPPSDYWWEHLPASDGLDIWDFIDRGATKEDIWREVKDDLSFLSSATEATEEENTEDEEQEILVNETRSLLQWSAETIEIDNLIPSLAQPFRLLGKAFNIPEVIFVAGFLPIGASLLSVGTRIEIAAGTNFYPPPVIWTGIVAESGSTKSPVFKILTAPLKLLQAEAEELYKRQMQAYDMEIANFKAREGKEPGDEPVKPRPRNYFFHDFTTEAIAPNLEGATNGSLVAVDELEEMLAGFNQYRRGKGNDRQKWLSIYDSGGIKVDRVSGKRLFLAATPLSILGTIQPEVLKQEMGDLNFVDGLWQRFLWVRLPLTKLPPPQETLSCDISQLLLGLYRRLEQLPPVTYRISPDARKLWNRWHEWGEEYKLSEPHPSIRSLYPKARERAARIALVLHVVEAVLTNRMPAPVVELDTIANAIAFVQWSINQTRILYADLGLTDHQQSSLIARFVERFQGQEIDAYRVRYWHSSKAKPSIPECRTFMHKLVELGYAQSNGKSGKEYKIILCNLGNWAIGQTRSQSPFPWAKPGQNWAKIAQSEADPKVEIAHPCPPVAQNLPTETRSESQFAHLPTFSTNTDIAVGDRVRYVGQEYWQICRNHVLTVKAVLEDKAVVTYRTWVFDHTFPLQDLQKVP